MGSNGRCYPGLRSNTSFSVIKLTGRVRFSRFFEVLADIGPNTLHAGYEWWHEQSRNQVTWINNQYCRYNYRNLRFSSVWTRRMSRLRPSFHDRPTRSKFNGRLNPHSGHAATDIMSDCPAIMDKIGKRRLPAAKLKWSKKFWKWKIK